MKIKHLTAMGFRRIKDDPSFGQIEQLPWNEADINFIKEIPAQIRNPEAHL